ncbi:MAG: metal ABC transporter permease [Actinomycetota bacterium]|nr:metal ABC transporter permease [Actinomycetota bacterium]
MTGILSDTAFTWNLADDFQQLFQYPFMVNAYRAGTIVSVLAAIVGWFMVLRRETFAGHALSVIGFPGAAGAVYVGLSSTLGYFAACLAAATVLARALRPSRQSRMESSAPVALIQAFALACGFLFISLYRGNLEGTTTFLFGTFLGVTSGQVAGLAIVASISLAVVALIGRPLLFTSLDADVAASRGVPTAAVSLMYFLVLGAAVAEASQITGSLLVFALLVLPPATAARLTARPGRSLLLSVTIAVTVTWTALACAYFGSYPIGFWITTIAFGLYVTVHALQAALLHRGRMSVLGAPSA